MKVIRNEDKKSNKYIIRFKVEKGKQDKFTEDGSNVMIKRTTEDYNNLVVYMADGSKPRYKNMPERQVRLLELMEQQQVNNEKELPKLKARSLISKTLTILMLGGACLFATFGVLDNYEIMNFLTFKDNLLFASGFSIATIIDYVNVRRIEGKIVDIEKNNYLKKNINILNSADLEDENVLENIKSKDKVEISNIKSKKEEDNDNNYFDINSINNLSLNTLKKLKSNIERENYLGLNDKNNSRSRGKSYVKK